MNRPSFATAWSASQRIYEPLNTSAKVAEMIGGYVEFNINNPDPEQQWTNTCAVRMSYILNEAGLVIPTITRETVSGADKRQYFYRVKNLIKFLERRWGRPEIVKYPTSADALAGRKGLILFEISGWSDAQGHATLFNGRLCYDHCYFNQPEAAYHTDKANFWSLK